MGPYSPQAAGNVAAFERGARDVEMIERAAHRQSSGMHEPWARNPHVLIDRLALLVSQRPRALAWRLPALLAKLEGLGEQSPEALKIARALNDMDAGKALVRLLTRLADSDPDDLEERLPALASIVGDIDTNARDDAPGSMGRTQAGDRERLASDIEELADRVRREAVPVEQDPFLKKVDVLAAFFSKASLHFGSTSTQS